jgi:hypothetical protein
MQTFHKVGTAAGIALAGGLVLAGKAAFEMTKKAAEDQQAAAKLANTIHKTTGATKEQQSAVEDWITAQGKATGVTDDELRPALSKLVVATHSVTKAQHLAMLAQDVSVGTGKSLESVSFALAKAQNGNVSGLARLGVATKDADGKTKSLNAITKDLAATYGGAAAKNAETAAGKQKILTTQYAELQEQIGGQLLPVMSKLLAVGLQIVNWISNNTKAAGILVGSLGAMLAIVTAVSAATKVWTAVTTIASVAMKIFTRQTEEADAALVANPIGIVVVALIALGIALVVAYKKSETFRNIVNAAFHAVQVVAGAVFNWVKDHWKLLFVIITGPIGLATLLVVKNFGKIQSAIQVLGKWATWLWNNAFQPALQLIVKGIGFMLNVWGHMLSALGHVPGFGWAKDAGAALQNAADRANALADNIRKIPAHKESTVVLNVVHNVVHTTGGHVPALAKGGIVRRPTIALVGEAGPEAVVPLSGRGPGLGGDVHVTINGALDPVAVGKQVQTVLLKLKRQNGNHALGLA